MTWTRLVFAAFLVFALGGCSLVSPDPDPVQYALIPPYEMRAFGSVEVEGKSRVRGILYFYGDAAPIVAPDTAVAGEPFEVTMTTFGGGCESGGGALVDTEGLRATIEPYDFTIADEETACTEELKVMPRTVEVTFDRPGEAVLRVVGLRVDAEHRDGAEWVVEKTVTVVD